MQDLLSVVKARDRGGYIPVVLAAAFWASSGSAAKYLFQTGMTPFQLVQFRTTAATAGIGLWLFLRDRRLFVIGRGDVPGFALLGVSLAVAQFTYLFAISRVHVAAAILLQYLSPAFIALYAATIGRKRLGAMTWTSVAGALGGCYLMVGGYDLDLLSLNRAGVSAGLLSAVTFALYTVRSARSMRSYDAWTVVFYAFLFAAVCWNVAHPPFEVFLHAYDPARWALLLGIGVFGTVLPFVLYNIGIRFVGATHAGVTATLEPVIAAVLSYLFLGEVLTRLQLAGGVIVVCSIAVLQLAGGEQKESDRD